MSNRANQELLLALRQGLIATLSLNELQTLCFELGVDYECIAGEGKAGKARELVLFFERTGNLGQLLTYCQTARPNYPWLAATDSITQTFNQAMTILFLGADPTDTARLRLDEEFRSLQLQVQLAEFRDRLRLETSWATRVADLTATILRVKPQIIHFAGHGQATGELCLENDAGEAQPVAPEALATLFALVADQVQCVVLNACHSVPQAQAIGQHIPYVIGMSREIGDQAALAFTVGFYQALGAGKPIPAAYEFGRVQIQLQGIPEHLTPVLQQK